MSIRALSVSALVLASVVAVSAADTLVVEQIVAKVNGDIVTRSELDRLRKQMEADLLARGATPVQVRDEMKDREKDLLRDKIDSLLLVQKGKDLEIKVDADVSKRLAQMALDAKIADPDKFAVWVKDNTGMSYEDFKQELKNQILTQRVVGQEVGNKINIPHEQVVDYYEKHKTEFLRQEQLYLREILISVAGTDAAVWAAAEKKAKDVVARARKGEKFSDLVRDNSDAVTAKQGGYLDPFKKGELRADMESATWDKDKGYVTDPIKIQAGFLILRVDDHVKAGQATVEEAENEIKEKLYQPLFQPKIREYLTQLRREAFLEIREGFIDTGGATGKDTRWQDPAVLKPETITKEEVSSRTHKKYLLWVLPIPHTSINVEGKSSSRT
jgi:parvulin-like peptidyl-prolyl isomerase